LSILGQWRTEARLALPVHRSAFTPPPKVMSAVVHLTPKAAPDAVLASALEKVTAAAFGQRRKMLRQSLRALGLPPEVLLAHAGIDPTARAETIDINGFAALARAYGELSRTHARVEPPAD
jgi:16S rRNA (adenine1518-N6/adenine1519-N6)-dimethyltransferase